MARKPKGYFEKRQTELLKNLEKATEPTINDLIKIYNKATENINVEIRKIYKNYSKNSILSKEVLNQLLNKKETEIHQKNLLKVINNIKDEELKKKLITKYNAPAYSYRISRLQALQDNIDVELKHIAELEEEVTKLRYIKTVDEAYYHNIYDIQKGTGYGFNFSQLDTRTMNMLLKQKWIGNANFSQRIWENSSKLNQFLKINFTADMMTGKSVQKIAKELSEYMNVGLYNATRLARTEVNHFANVGELLAYEECEIDRYEFIATLDNVTCDRCASLDKKVFKVKEAKQGVNFPPIHSNDRCTTVAYFGEEEAENLQRRARDEEGNSILVPDDMNYQQWREKYVTNLFKNDKIVPYIRKNVEQGYNTINEEKAIKDAISLLPKKIAQSLDKGMRFEIVTENMSDYNFSRYDSNLKIIYIYQNANKYEVIHEIGHFIEDVALSKNKEYLKLKQELIDNSKLTVIERDNREIYALKNDKFVDEYQGYLHIQTQSQIWKYGKIDYDRATEIFSESFREYFENPENLKKKLPKFYNMIRELLK